MAVSATKLKRYAQEARTRGVYKSDGQIILESNDESASSYDVFLCHARIDRELVLGARELLTKAGYKVYVDWIDDRELDRTQVTTQTADQLRRRMRQSKSLVYAHTRNSSTSKWCPWELGYFDGVKGGNVFRLPISDMDNNGVGDQEYIGLYPYIDELQGMGQTRSRIHVRGSNADGMAALYETFTSPVRKDGSSKYL